MIKARPVFFLIACCSSFASSGVSQSTPELVPSLHALVQGAGTARRIFFNREPGSTALTLWGGQ